MDKLEKLPFKVLFYLGFIIVIIFIGLSYWQLTSHYDDRNNLENITKYEKLLKVSISDINNLSEFQESSLPQKTQGLGLDPNRVEVHQPFATVRKWVVVNKGPKAKQDSLYVSTNL